MALQGTIDSFPIVDVVQLLSSSAKTGRLELVGDRGRAALWIAGGDLVAGTAQGKHCGDPAESLWELLRYSDGTFEFVEGDLPTGPGFDPASVTQMIERATQMQAEWEQIERRVPSMSHRVELVATLPGAEVRLSAEDWAVVVAAGGGLSVASLIERVGLEEFEGCRRLAEMVDRGLLGIEVATVPAGAAPEALGEPREVEMTKNVVSPSPSQGAADAFAAASGQSAPDPQPAAATMDVVQVQEPVALPAEMASGSGHESPATAPGGPAPQMAPQAPDPAGFPDHFPIDDLVAAPEPTWEPNPADAGRVGSIDSTAVVGTPPDPVHAPEVGVASAGGVAHDPSWGHGAAPQVQAADASAQAGAHGGPWAAEAAAPVVPVPPAPHGDQPPEDDVLAQIGRLSPKAAEAIAAALGDGVERGPAG